MDEGFFYDRRGEIERELWGWGNLECTVVPVPNAHVPNAHVPNAHTCPQCTRMHSGTCPQCTQGNLECTVVPVPNAHPIPTMKNKDIAGGKK